MKPVPCGTDAGYRRHRYLGEEACQQCKDAHSEAGMAWVRLNGRPRSPLTWLPREWTVQAEQATNEVLAQARSRGVVQATDPLDLFGRTDHTADLWDRAGLWHERVNRRTRALAAMEANLLDNNSLLGAYCPHCRCGVPC